MNKQINQVLLLSGLIFFMLWLFSLAVQVSDFYDYRFSLITISAGVSGACISLGLLNKKVLFSLSPILCVVISLLLNSTEAYSTPAYILVTAFTLLASTFYFSHIHYHFKRSGLYISLAAIIAIVILYILYPAVDFSVLSLASIIMIAVSTFAQSGVNPRNIVISGVVVISIYYLASLPGNIEQAGKTDGMAVSSNIADSGDDTFNTGNSISIEASYLAEILAISGNTNNALLISSTNDSLINQISKEFRIQQLSIPPPFCFNCRSDSSTKTAKYKSIELADLLIQEKHYDNIIAFMPDIKPTYWFRENPAANLLFSQYILKDILKSMDDSGTLVIFSKNELLFQKSIILAWHTLSNMNGGTQSQISRQLWGFRAASMDDSDSKKSYPYILLARKSPLSTQQEKLFIDKINEISNRAFDDKIIFSPLFGKDLPDNKRYRHINKERKLGFSSFQFEGLQSRQFRTHIDMRSTSFDRPFPFLLMKAPHSHLKWLIALICITLLLVLLLPLAGLRKVDSMITRHVAPLPVFLLMFFCAATLVSFSGIGIILIPAMTSYHSFLPITVAALATSTGVITGSLVHRRLTIRTSLFSAILLSLLALAASLEAMANIAVFIKSNSLNILFALIMGYVSGLFGCVLFSRLYTYTTGIISELEAWAPVVYGLSISLGTCVSVWIIPLYGLEQLAILVVATSLLLFLFYAWIASARVAA